MSEDQTKWLKVSFRRYFPAVVAAATTMVATIGFYQEFRNYRAVLKVSEDRAQHYKKELADLERQNYELRERLDDFQEKIAVLQVAGSSGQPVPADSLKIAQLEASVEILTTEMDALKQNLDPSRSEVFAVARLRDLVLKIEEDRAGFEKKIEADNERFERFIGHQLAASRDSVRWLFVVLIPLLLNFLYTVWKDWRKAQSEAA